MLRNRNLLPKRESQKKPAADASLLASQTKKGALVSKKKKKDKEKKLEIAEIPAPETVGEEPTLAEEEEVVAPIEKKEGIEAKQVPAAEETALPEAKSVAEEGVIAPIIKKKHAKVTFRRLTAQEMRKKKKRSIPTTEEGEMRQSKRP